MARWALVPVKDNGRLDMGDREIILCPVGEAEARATALLNAARIAEEIEPWVLQPMRSKLTVSPPFPDQASRINDLERKVFALESRITGLEYAIANMKRNKQPPTEEE